MAYQKQTWISGDTISAARLNQMEDGIFDAHETIKNRPIASGDDGTTDASNSSNLSNSTIASTSYVANYTEGKINSLPTATVDRKGFVQIGEGLSIDSAGVISISAATTSSKGLIQVGNNLSIDNGIISAAYATEGTYNSSTNKLVTKNAMDTAISDVVTNAINAIPTASASTPGLVQIGSGLSINNTGTVSVNLPHASQSTAGLIKVGSGLSINSDGELSVNTNSDGTINLANLSGEFTNLDPYQTIRNLTQNQGQIYADFQSIPDAFYTPGNTEDNIPETYTHGLISAADLQKLYTIDNLLSLDRSDNDTQDYLLISRQNANLQRETGWAASINNFSVNGILSINDRSITTIDENDQETTTTESAKLQIGNVEITSNTLKIGNTTLNENQLIDLLGLLSNNNN